MSANKTDLVAFNQNTGKFYTARVKDGDTMLNSYVLGPGSGMGSGSALIFCLIPYLLEESEFEPMFNEVKGKLSGKKIALFGSYGWGDGEWMRTWQARCAEKGIALAADSVKANNAPDDEAIDNCKKLGAALA